MTNALGEEVLFADHSYLADAADCARLSYWKHELGVEPLGAASAQHFGKVIHAAVHHLHTNNFDLEGALKIVNSTWQGYVTAPGDWRTLGHAELVIRNYHEDRQGDALEPLQLTLSDLNHDAIESFNPVVDPVSGMISFAETPIAAWLDEDLVYAGLIDFPATLHGPVYVVDHKTTSMWVTERWAREYAQSFQLKGYVAILEAITGIKPAGYYINGIHVGKNAADDKDAWKKRSSVRSGLFGPYVVKPHEGEALRSWIRGHMRTIEFYREEQKRFEAEGRRPEDAWPMNTGRCSKYGGCGYAQLCHNSPAVRNGILRTHYRERSLTGILASGADS